MPSQIKIIENKTQLEELIHYCQVTKYASIDFETQGLNYFDRINSYPLTISTSFQPGSSWVLPLGHHESPFKKNYPKLLTLYGKEVIENKEITKIAWNLKYEQKWFMRYGIFMKGRIFDAMLAKYCLDEERPHGLKEFVSKMFPEFSEYEKMLGKDQEDDFVWKNVPLQTLSTYNGLDSDLTLRGMIYLEKRLIDLGFYNLFRNLLMMATRVLSDMEYRGAYIDRSYLEGLMGQYEIKIKEVQSALKSNPMILKFEKKKKQNHLKRLIESVRLDIEEIKEEGKPNAARLIANRELKIKGFLEGKFSNKDRYEGVNFASPKQMADLFFESKFGFKFKPVKKTDSGGLSTDEEVLLKLKPKDKSGFIDSLLKLRELDKLNSTYIVGMHKLLTPYNRLHPNFHLLTVTGRLGCVHEDTQILTNKGNIRIGDLVPELPDTYNILKPGLLALTHKGNYKPITMGIHRGFDEMYEVELENGKKIKCTLEHKFLTNRGWLQLKEIYNTDCKEIEILSYED